MLEGRLAITEHAARAIEREFQVNELKCSIAMVESESQTKIAKARQDAAEDALKDTRWWSRYAPLMLASGIVIALLGGAAAGFALHSALK
jgi:hypothetical protein